MVLRNALLGLLARGPMSGYDLTKFFDAVLSDAWTASHSQIYPELARLREEGLIRQAGEGPRGRKTYEVTEQGRAEVRRWLVETEPERAYRHEAMLRVFFLWLLDDEDIHRYLERERDYHRAQLAVYEELERLEPADPADRASRLALEWGIRFERNLVEWAEWAQEQVRGGFLSGTRRRSRARSG